MQSCFLSWVCLLIGHFLWGQSPVHTSQNNTKENISAIAKYEQLIKYYRYYKQDSAIYYTNKGMELARQTGDSNAVGSMLLQKGMINDNLGEFDKSKQEYNQALELFKIAGSKKGIASATIRIGVVELRNGKYDNSIKYFLDALKTSEEITDKFGIMEANYSISWAYLDQKNFDAALKYLETAEEVNKQLPFSNISLNIYNHFGVVYREKANYKKAEYYLNKGIQLSDKPEYQGLNITMINNLATVYAKDGKKEKAILLQQQALRRSREIGNYLRELQTLMGLSKTYGNENPDKAIFYIKQAVELAREKKVPKQEMRYLKVLADFYKSQGNFRDAFTTKEREHNLADTFFYKTTAQNIESLKSEYELSKSNARIKELDLLNNKRQLELKNSTIMRNVMIAGTALLLIILGLLYNQYRIKQRNSNEARLQNQSLERLLDEKEWLLKEVHHRVKNNLQTVMSLLETQSAYLKDDALVAVQNSQHRVYAMSLIHQKLYQQDNSTNINMAVYLPELISYLSDSYDTRKRIQFRTHIENIQLDISQAIPTGLILNEAITNSIKYAFPDRGNGEIHVCMKIADKKNILLSITDNGIGFPTEWSTIQKNSLGMKLMKGLSDDLQAKFHIESSKGTKISLEFQKNYFIRK